MNRLETVKTYFKKSKNVAIISHKDPDGDALCSAFALKKYLDTYYKRKKVSVFADGNIDEKYNPIINEEINKNPRRFFDLVIIIDCPNIERTGQYKKIAKWHRKIINIDHHLIPITRYVIVNHLALIFA